MTPTELVTLRGKLEQYEGIVEHMYLDGVGLVTVGVGHMIPSADSAAALSFWHRKTGAAATATAEDIKADYAAAAKEPNGKVFTYYKSKTAPFMSERTSTP